MEVRSIDNTQFGAKLVAPAKIRYKAGRLWKDLDVNLVKFETAKMSDRAKLDAVSRLWGGRNLSSSIAEEANILGGKSNVYGLTLQQTNLNDVMPDHILGLMTTGKVTKNSDKIEVFKIGTHPKYAYEQNHRSREIKHIATSMLETLKAYTGKKAAPKLYTHYATPEEMKFLNKVGVDVETDKAVEIIG